MSLPIIAMLLALAPIAIGVVLLARGRPVDEDAPLRKKARRARDPDRDG